MIKYGILTEREESAGKPTNRESKLPIGKTMTTFLPPVSAQGERND